jgi:hypothetical protein
MRYFKFIFFLLFFKSGFGQTAKTELVLEQNEISKIQSELKLKNINDEEIAIEANKFGKIISVKSLQKELLNILVGKWIVPQIEQSELVVTKKKISIKGKKIENYHIINLQADTIKGQIITVVKLAELMNGKKYSEAKKLFSKRQQGIINKIDNENFTEWSNAWTLDEQKLKRYTDDILAGNERNKFIFESGAWKINEN